MTCDPDLTSPIAKFFGCGTQYILDNVFGSTFEQQSNAVIGLMITLGMILIAGFYLMWRESKINNQPFWLDLNNPSNWSRGFYSAPPPFLAVGSALWALTEYQRMHDPIWSKYFQWYFLAIPIAVTIFWVVLFIIIRLEAKKEKKRLGL